MLAYLGGIKRSYSSEQSARISKLGHLDLSNVKPVPTNAAPSLQSSKDRLVKPIEPEPIDTEIAIPISLSSVLSVQKRVQKALGVTVPLSIFIARATELANDDLPRSTATKPTANELFDDILGLANVRLKSSRGSYTPQITALPNKIFAKRAITQKHPDVYDILAGKTSTTAVYPATEATPWETMAGPETGEATNVFSVSAARGEEQRARVFLERVKTILQVEPGRLVL